jgi:hypothetical protein
MSLIQIWAHDRQKAAVHEAGHVVIARMLNINAHAVIYYLFDNNNPRYEMTWGGQTQTDLAGAGRRKRSMVGVAGLVAELCWRGECMDDTCWLLSGIMSESDWKTTGCVPGVPDEYCLEAIFAVTKVLEPGASQRDNLVKVARGFIISAKWRASTAAIAY